MSLLAHILTLLGGHGLPDPLPAEPFPLLLEWFNLAQQSKATANPNAIVLATATPDGHPSARVVLCKELRPAEHAVVFFTNLQSRKARELAANPHAAVVFHFDAQGKQARVEGIVQPLPAAECDAYFATRPTISQVGAWASQQSQPIASRADFAQRIVDAMTNLGISPLALLATKVGAPGPLIPRPPNWGGYMLVARRVELWTNSEGRLHDRAQWTRLADSAEWVWTRLQP